MRAVNRLCGGPRPQKIAWRPIVVCLQESPPPAAHRSVSGVDQRLAEIVDRCLERDPQLRLANAQIVLDLLDQRDRTKSRRPLLILALLGPLLFLAAMFWIAETAIPRCRPVCGR